jgi:hypothetical protein
LVTTMVDTGEAERSGISLSTNGDELLEWQRILLGHAVPVEDDESVNDPEHAADVHDDEEDGPVAKRARVIEMVDLTEDDAKTGTAEAIGGGGSDVVSAASTHEVGHDDALDESPVGFQPIAQMRDGGDVPDAQPDPGGDGRGEEHWVIEDGEGGIEWHDGIPAASLRRLRRYAERGGRTVAVRRDSLQAWSNEPPTVWTPELNIWSKAGYIYEVCDQALRPREDDEADLLVRRSWLDDWRSRAKKIMHKKSTGRSCRRGESSLTTGFQSDAMAVLLGAPSDGDDWQAIQRSR